MHRCRCHRLAPVIRQRCGEGSTCTTGTFGLNRTRTRRAQHRRHIVELTQLLQPMGRELATLDKEIERLEIRQEQLARDNANVVGQLKASQEQMARDIANVSEQLKASQEQIARDNSNLAEQLKASQEQMARARLSEQNPSPKIPEPSRRQTVTSTASASVSYSAPRAHGTTADEGDEVARLQPILVHMVLYRLHWVREIHWIMQRRFDR